MFLHLLKYDIKIALKNKQMIFWLFAFPAILGTFFYIAFGNLFSEESFDKIPVAVVTVTENQNFEDTLEQVSKGKDGLFKIKHADDKKAKQLLEDGKVSGIIYVDEELSLTVKGEGTSQTIIQFFLDQYTATSEAVTEEMSGSNPLRMISVMQAVRQEISPQKEKDMPDGNQDPYVQYFYNLLAMSCLFASFGGVDAVIRTQANTSAFGARKCVAPVSKFCSMTASFLAQVMLSFSCNFLAMLYLRYVLGVKFGVGLGLMTAVLLAGSLTGISAGFLVGSLCRSENMAIPLLVAVMMFFCFMSGLMIGNMRGIVEMHFPLFNHINPAALITDSFYVLNMYGANERFASNILLLSGMTIVFMSAGALVTGRKKYAAL